MAGTDLRAFDDLAEHPRLGDLVSITRAIATSAAESRKASWTDAAKVKALAEEAKLADGDAKTPYGDAIAVLERGPEDDAERALARALWAHAIAEEPPKDRDEEDRVAVDVLWLATHTPFDATRLLDRALGDAASELWDAIADRVRRVDQGKLATLGRAEAIVGGAALAGSESPAARKQAESLAGDVNDDALARVLRAPPPKAPPDVLAGELAAAPRGPLATVVLAMTGILFVANAARLVAHFALGYRVPAEIALAEDVVRVRARTELLGRTLKEREIVIPREGLVAASREVRFPRLALYAGLLALAVGSYFGVDIFVDGARAASPSLLLTGILVVAAGIFVEMLLGSIEPGTAGRCRVVLVPARGKAVCVARLDRARAEAALARLAAKGSVPPAAPALRTI
jgi:hypothetical protein